MKWLKRNKQIVLPALAVLLICSCKSEFSKLIPEKDYSDSLSVAYGDPKVLYIMVDGARGTSVQNGSIPNIKSLLPHSIYSWYSMSEEEVTGDGANWADMVTGVKKNKHGIVNNDYSNADLATYPTLYTRIKEAIPDIRSVVFTRSQEFKDHFTQDAGTARVIGNDAAIKDSVVSRLSQESIGFITAHFTGVDEAGKAGAYDLSSSGYASAIQTFDSYVGDIMSALRARKNYAQENWLVVITSSRGGKYVLPPDENDNTVFSETTTNTFTIYYSPRYAQHYINKPYLGNRFLNDFVRFKDNLHAQVTEGDDNIYNFGNGEFTIEMKVKKNPGPDGNYKFNYPAVLGKRAVWDAAGSANGWVIFLEDNYWQFNAKGTAGVSQVYGGSMASATWNSIAVVGYLDGTSRRLRTFSNGKRISDEEISGSGNFDSQAPLTLGYIPGDRGTPDVYISDVRIWKTALTDSIINLFSCETYIDESHPGYKHLAGWWPVYGSTANTIQDQGPLASNMTLSGGQISWDRLNEYVCAPTIEDVATAVPSGVDIAAQIITWFRIPRQQNWQMDGRVWLDQ